MHFPWVHKHVKVRSYIQGDNLDTAINKLRVFFGWSETSQMPRHYARAYFESGLADVWNDSYDTFVETLRDLQGKQI